MCYCYTIVLSLIINVGNTIPLLRNRHLRTVTAYLVCDCKPHTLTSKSNMLIIQNFRGSKKGLLSYFSFGLIGNTSIQSLTSTAFNSPLLDIGLSSEGRFKQVKIT